MRTLFGAGLFALASVVWSVPAFCQADLGQLFGTIIQSGIEMSAQSAWEQLPAGETSCISRRLTQRGSSINQIIRQGLTPDDSRIAGIRSDCRNAWSVATLRAEPSFDCSRASLPDERALCGDDEASRLDNIMARGFAYLKSRYGEQAARAVGTPLLRSRQQCGANLACIKNAQRSAIQEYQARGAPIELPKPQADIVQPARTIYSVDGLALGGRVNADSPIYAEYRCTSSGVFPGFTWCQRRKTENSPRGQYISSNSILHSADGTSYYINRYLEPAFFTANEANDDINRLAKKFGTPRIIPMPKQSDVPYGMIAIWGNVNLEPLNAATVAQLAAGNDVRAGILIDHIGNFRRSAQNGLPIYRINGGAGYVWAASWNASGVGTLRFLTADMAAVDATIGNAAPASTAAPIVPQAAPAASTVAPAPDPAPVVLPPVVAPPAVAKVDEVRKDETTIALERIRRTIKRINEQRDDIPGTDSKSRLDDISSRLATAADKMDMVKLQPLLRDCDAVDAMFVDAGEFKDVSAIASRKVETVNTRLSSIDFDAPLIRKIKTSLEVVTTAQAAGDLSSLKQALTQLNQTYDTAQLARLVEAKGKGFDSIEAYDEFKLNQTKLGKSGIRLNTP